MPKAKKNYSTLLKKTPTGIEGFDEITFGGLPKGRPTLIAGNAGCGKTLFGMEFLARGARQFDEPGVMMSFEETAEELTKNFSSLGFKVNDLIAQKKLLIEFVAVERSEMEETGEYDLEGLFVRLDYAINTIKAKRVVLDTIEALFSGLTNEAIVRAELRRLFKWLKSRGVTAIITGEKGVANLTRHGLEEYVADCVILLDHTVVERSATRRLRVVKYRGSAHGTDEFPFLIQETGISVLPITSLNLEHTVSKERISTGIERLDSMLDGKGFYRGSSILISGPSGTGKSTLAAHFTAAACKRNERVLYFAFEESGNQIARNMLSVGINLEPFIKNGTLLVHAARHTAYGLEMHLATMHKIINDFKPKIIIVDPMSNLMTSGTITEVKSMLVRLIDFIKVSQITAMFTDLGNIESAESTGVGVSSLMDTWILLKSLESYGERNRGIYVLKARGMNHSNQIREFAITSRGINLIDAYSGADGVLAGTARVAQEALDNASLILRNQETARKHRESKRKKLSFEAEFALLKSKYETEEDELNRAIEQETVGEAALLRERRKILGLRSSDQTIPAERKRRR
jgi:RecA-superfamily ATPases implicated in signal transduction